MQPINFEEVLDRIVGNDARFHREAYLFVREGLDFTQKQIRKSAKGEIRHITGQELLGGLRDYGLSQYGPMLLTLLKDWGISSSEDFGEIVFNMVEHGLLSKTEQDSREDFKNGLDFFEAFEKPFLPPSKQTAPQPPQSEQQRQT